MILTVYDSLIIFLQQVESVDIIIRNQSSDLQIVFTIWKVPSLFALRRARATAIAELLVETVCGLCQTDFKKQRHTVFLFRKLHSNAVIILLRYFRINGE